MSYQVWYVACHVLLIYVNFLICLMPILMYLVSSFVCDVLKFLHAIPKLSSYVNFNTGCMLIGMWYLKTFSCVITIHLRYTKISIFAVSSFLIFGISTSVCDMPNLTNDCCIKICQRFHFCHHPIQWEVIITCSSLLV